MKKNYRLGGYSSSQLAASHQDDFALGLVQYLGYEEVGVFFQAITVHTALLEGNSRSGFMQDYVQF